MQALVRVLVDQMRVDRAAGLNTGSFVSGYPGSPIATFDLELSHQRELLSEYGIVHVMGVNEELGLTAVAGSQVAHTREAEMKVDGVVGAWYGKAPGLDRSIDALRHAAMAGTDPKGGVVLFVGDDSASKSSTIPSWSESVLAAVGVSVLYPADQQELLDYGRHAIEMSRASGMWSALKIVADVADGTSAVNIDVDRISIVKPDNVINGVEFQHALTGFLLPPSTLSLEATLNSQRPIMAMRYASANGLNKCVAKSASDKLGIIAAGKTYLDLIESLARIGLTLEACEAAGIRILKLGMIHPIDPTAIHEFVSGIDTVLVVEEKRTFVEAAIKDVLYGTKDAPQVHGKRGPAGDELLPSAGVLDVGRLTPILAKYLAERINNEKAQAWLSNQRPTSIRIDLPMISRPPFVCSGCPHSSSMRIPDDVFIGTGTGCGFLTSLQKPGIAEGGLLAQMGGEGAQWIGMAPFMTRDRMTQHIGDGTFHHSGHLAIRAAVAAGVNMTYKIFYNSAVAMTGGQNAPGVLTIPELVDVLVAEGVTRVVVTTDELKKYRGVKFPKGVKVRDRTEIVAVQEEFESVKGISVLIHEQECATEKRRKRKRGLMPDPVKRIVINERVCEGCGDCGTKSNCLSVEPVETEFGRKTRINQTTCNKDYTCVSGDCPSFVQVIRGTKIVRKVSSWPQLSQDELPTPKLRSADESVDIRICGIGGTGVVTVAQILAQAAHIAGVDVHGVDQTGLAQKGGAVVSDIKLGRRSEEPAARVAPGSADVYIACDLIVAADPMNVAVIKPGHTIAVGSTRLVPTGAMVVNPKMQAPNLEAVAAELTELCGEGRYSLFDAQTISKEIFGGEQYSNIMLLGAAFQLGALSLPASAIEEAIAINGVAVESNVQAFRRGRQMVANPKALASISESSTEFVVSQVEKAITDSIGIDPDSNLYPLVSKRVQELSAYQNTKYAQQFATVMADVVNAERTIESTEFSEAVAVGLHKLMAYKDEYEVARLHLDPQMQLQIREEFGQDAKISLLLHPPILRSLGMQNKIAFGPGSRWIIRLLAVARKLRGTPFDIFGYAHVRRVERELIEEYSRDMHWAIEHLNSRTHDSVVKLASLPDVIRGYEFIKLDNVEIYRVQRAELREEIALKFSSTESISH